MKRITRRCHATLLSLSESGRSSNLWSSIPRILQSSLKHKPWPPQADCGSHSGGGGRAQTDQIWWRSEDIHIGPGEVPTKHLHSPLTEVAASLHAKCPEVWVRGEQPQPGHTQEGGHLRGPQRGERAPEAACGESEEAAASLRGQGKTITGIDYGCLTNNYIQCIYIHLHLMSPPH